MTFEEWWGENKYSLGDCDDPSWIAKRAWNAAKEDSKLVAEIVNPAPHYFYVQAADADVVTEKYSVFWDYPRFYTHDAAEKWALEQGYRIK